MTEIFFWGATLLMLIPYIIYPGFLYVLELIAGKAVKKKDDYFPSVSVIVAAANEQATITRRVDNILEQDYPADKLEVIVVSDCSDDLTDSIVKSFSAPNVRLLRNSVRQGKSAAQNLGARDARGDILMFTDSDTLFESNYLQNLMSNFGDPTVGSAHGKIYFTPNDSSTVTKHMNAYMAFELWLRGRESSLGVLLTSTGANTAVRRKSFRPQEVFASEDVTIPLDCAEQNSKMIYDPEAVCHDVYYSRSSQELSSRIRSTIRTYSSLWSRRRAWHLRRHPTRAAVIICHRFLRYAFPFMMIIVLGTNVCLLNKAFYQCTFTMQILFYTMVAIWPTLRRMNVGPAWLGGPFNLCVANLAFFVATLKAFRGKKVSTFRDRSP